MEETYSLSNALKERLAKAATEGEPMNMVKTMENGIEIKLDNFEIGTGLPYAKVVEEGIPLEKIAKAAREAKPAAKPSTDVKKADDKKTPAKKEEKKAAKKDAAKKEDAKKAETKKAEDKKKEADKKAEDAKKEADKKAEEAKKAAEKAEKK